MNKTLLIASALLSIQSFGQSYKTIYPARTTHYSSVDANSPGKIFYNTISIDSSVAIAGGEVLYNFMNFQDSASRVCYPANYTTWIGRNPEQAATGEEYFFNSTGDTIYLIPQSPLNATWHLYNYSSGNYVEATVTSIALQTFIGLTDSVKTITLAVKDNVGNPVSNILNGKQLKVSENYGFVQTPGFRYFPLDTIMHTISGSEDFSAGIMNITEREIYDFNVGDEFHYHEQIQPSFSMHDFDWYINRILSKSYSSDSSSVTYSIDHCYRHEHLDAPTFYVVTGHDTIIGSYQLSGGNTSLYRFNWQIGDTASAAWMLGGTNGHVNFYSDTTYNGRLKKSSHYYYMPDGIQPCYGLCICDCAFPDITYAAGLGYVHNGAGCGGGDLVYFKKGAEEWGTPLTCSVLLSTDVDEDKPVPLIYPNPFASSLTIKNAGIITLFDYTGKEVLHQKTSSNETTLNTEDIAAGFYLLRVEDGREVKNYKVVKEN